MIGIFSALGAALSWTYACHIWRNQSNNLAPAEINLIKNIIAFVVFIPSFIYFDFINDIKSIFLLLISGIIGIGIGDTLYIKSLKLIGTRKTLSIEALSPLFAGLSGNIFINEDLTARSWIGIILFSGSLIMIILDRKNIFKNKYLPCKDKIRPKNYIFAFLSVFCAVVGALLSRLVFKENDYNPIQTTEIRLFGSILLLISFTKVRVNFFNEKSENKDKITFFLSILMGTNIGILLQQIVFKTLPLGIGWSLLSISPLISLVFAKKEEGGISWSVIIPTISLLIGLTLIVL